MPRTDLSQSLSDKILIYLGTDPGWTTPLTAGQISKALDEPLNQVSSVLRKLVVSGNLFRYEGKGPRGGFTYSMDHEAYKEQQPS